jgi:hypothetical protein
MSKRILADIKVSEDKIEEDLKKIKEIQMNLSKSHDDNKQPDLNIKYRMNHKNGEMQPHEADDEMEEKAEHLKLKHQIRFDSMTVPAFGEVVHYQLKKRFNKEI